MTWQKRLLDVLISSVLVLILFPFLIVLIVVLLIIQGRPIFYVSERMRTPTASFQLIKLRTMPVMAGDGGVTGGNKMQQMSRMQRLLRASRADELPQLWNVLRGDISLVGPRPPLRIYVDAYPVLYGQVLQNRPGITGLASLRFHAHEERLMQGCSTAAETDAVYRRQCIPRKARLDAIYAKHASVCFDLALISETAIKPLRRKN